MSTQSITGTAAGTFGPVALSGKNWQSGEGVGVVCTVSTGATANYTVNVTGDNINFGIPKNWTPHPDIIAQTGSITANIAYPVTAAELVVSALTTGGTVTVSFIATDLAGG